MDAEVQRSHTVKIRCVALLMECHRIPKIDDDSGNWYEIPIILLDEIRFCFISNCINCVSLHK